MTALRDEAMVREMLVEASRAAWAQAAVLAGPAASLYCQAESPFSRAKSVNCPQHKCDVCDARRVLARANDAAAHDEAASRILAAHPAPSTPPIAALHASAVERVMRLWDATHEEPAGDAVRRSRWSDSRRYFESLVTDSLAQEYQRISCDLATNKDAAELMSAAGWLDKDEEFSVFNVGNACLDVEWTAGVNRGRESTLPLAILAAARSLGWPGGGK